MIAGTNRMAEDVQPITSPLERGEIRSSEWRAWTPVGGRGSSEPAFRPGVNVPDTSIHGYESTGARSTGGRRRQRVRAAGPEIPHVFRNASNKTDAADVLQV